MIGNLIAAVIWPCLYVLDAEPSQTPSLPAIAAAMRERPNPPESWRATLTHRLRTRSQADPAIPLVERAQWNEHTWYANGRQNRLTRKTIRMVDGRATVVGTHDRAYNGAETREYASASGWGVITPASNGLRDSIGSRIWCGIVPRLKPAKSDSLADLANALIAFNAQVEPATEDIDGFTCHTVTVQDTLETTHQVAIAPTLGYLVVRDRVVDGGGRVVFEQLASDLREVVPGVWIPYRVRQVGYLFATDQPYEAYEAEFVVGDDADFRAVATPRDFHVAFPANTAVLDAIQDWKYRIVDVSEE